MKKNVKALCVLGSILLIVGVCIPYGFGPIRARIHFAKLRWHRKDPAMARPLVKHLAASRWGIRLCILDLDAYGGTTRGWSSQVIMDSNDTEYVSRKLVSVAKGDPSLARRIEASFLLWQKMKQEEYLQCLYVMVRHTVPNESPQTIRRGREILLAVFGHAERAAEILDKPPSEDLALSESDWRDFCDSYLATMDQP